MMMTNTEYIGQGVLTGWSDSEMDLAVESQKCAHPDSSEDTADSDHFSVPAKPAPHPPKKTPPVVVSLANPGPSQLWNMTATVVTVVVARPLKVRLQLVALPRMANISYLPVLVMSQNPLGVLVAPKALNSNGLSSRP